MNYTIYHPTTGEILHVISVSNPDCLNDMLEGNSYIHGHWSPVDYYIQDGQPRSKPDRPTNAHVYYEFDPASHTWQIDPERTAYQVRQHRNLLLDAVDRVNPVRYLSLTTEQQQELSDYRSALLAVPQQSGYPESIEWPGKPAWL